jgi:beta-glucanase (GH16 family)
MARYTSLYATYLAACICAAIATLVLAAPAEAAAQPQGSTRSHHHEHRHRARKVEGSAGNAAKRVPAKARRTGRRTSHPRRPATVFGSLVPSALTPSESGAQDTPSGGSPDQQVPTKPASAAEMPTSPWSATGEAPGGERSAATEQPATKPPTIELPATGPPGTEPPAKESSAQEQSNGSEPVAEPPIESDPPSSRKLIWSDEFNGSAGTSPDSDKWSFDTGGNGWGNQELESYTSRPANAELNGQGDLAIMARAEKYTGADGITRSYTSARMQTLNTFQFQYGLVEARMKVPVGQGLVAQFWALGHEGYESEEAWPGCGEIDTMEVLGSEPNIVNGTLHGPWSWAPTGVQGTKESATPLSAEFHIYSVEWEPERISFMLDGSVYKTITRSELPAGAAWPFNHPYFLLLDLAVGGEWPGSPDASTHFPAQMLVDWVRVWQ